MTDDGTCDECGGTHEEGTYSEAVAQITEAISTTTDPQEKRLLLVDFVECVAQDVDDLRLAVPEQVHEMLNDLASARLAYEQVAMRLARVLYPAVSHHFKVRPRVRGPSN